MKKLTLLIGFILLGLNLFGQYPWVVDMYTYPPFPTTEYPVSLVAEIRTASAGCHLFSSEVEIDEVNKVVEITACYSVGPLDTICPSIDTFLIGLLSEGVYKVELTTNGFEAFVNPNGPCYDGIPLQENELKVLVNGDNTGFNQIPGLSIFSIRENPVRDYAVFRIKSDEIITQLSIVDNLGRILVNNSVEDKGEFEIITEVWHLPPGIYYCYLISERGKSNPIKMIKQ